MQKYIYRLDYICNNQMQIDVYCDADLFPQKHWSKYMFDNFYNLKRQKCEGQAIR